MLEVANTANLREGMDLYVAIVNLEGWEIVPGQWGPTEGYRGVRKLRIGRLELEDCDIRHNHYVIAVKQAVLGATSCDDSCFALLPDGRIMLEKIDLANLDPEAYNVVIASVRKDLGLDNKSDTEVKKPITNARKRIARFLES